MTPHTCIMRTGPIALSVAILLAIGASFSDEVLSQIGRSAAQDPGVRLSSSSACPGGTEPPCMLDGLTAVEQQAFKSGLDAFKEVASVQGEGFVKDTEAGLGPRFNLDSCAGCHAFPNIGGTSPFVNPQAEVAKKEGAINDIPPFITGDGPIREARFKYNPDGTPDGGVHALFTITGRSDASGCVLQQPDFRTAMASKNVVFRIPTPTFGAGLIEAIDDNMILANLMANGAGKQALGIQGRPNRTSSGHPNASGNDGTITRFGLKAQNKSLEIFSGEAYNVEQGVTNDLFPQERDESPGCRFNVTPESTTHFGAAIPLDVPSDVVKFAVFMRLLAPPPPAPNIDTTGQKLFGDVGCAMCHTPTLHTGQKNAVAALQNKPVNLYSDLVLHHMGAGLADDVSQGNAGGDEFRTAPLWGVGQRVFFLHDGRTKDLLEAIQAHAGSGSRNYPPSEANQVVARFNRLTEADKQHILNFLRAL